MGYLKDRINVKENPNILLSNVKRVLSFSLDYLTVPLNNLKDKINHQKEPYISVYAHGIDYHQIIKLAELIAKEQERQEAVSPDDIFKSIGE